MYFNVFEVIVSETVFLTSYSINEEQQSYWLLILILCVDIK